MSPARAPSGLLDAAVEQSPLDGHDGRSGARLERVRLADGTRLVVKRTSAATDVVRTLTGATGDREARLWREGILAQLPAEVGHPVLDAWEEDGETVIVMRDLGDAVVGWDRVLSRAEVGRILAATTALHRAFRGRVPPGLCPLADLLALFSPPRLRGVADRGWELTALALRGWEHFARMAPADVAGAVAALHADPAPLAQALTARGTTLVHGDLWLVNVALTPEGVVLLDWGAATAAPPAVEVATFLTGSAANMSASREEVLDDFRAQWGADHDEVALRLALLGGLCQMGWNKALDAAEHPDPRMRARERADLDWWVTEARRTLDAGLLPWPR